MRFIDSDRAIEKQAGKRIPKIFEEEGEAAFRAREREFVETGHPATGCVVSCGGGLITQPGMSERLREKGLVVCLFASPETIIERTKRNKKRPLLNVENPEERIRELLREREPYYRSAPVCIGTDGRTLNEIVAHLDRSYRNHLPGAKQRSR